MTRALAASHLGEGVHHILPVLPAPDGPRGGLAVSLTGLSILPQPGDDGDPGAPAPSGHSRQAGGQVRKGKEGPMVPHACAFLGVATQAVEVTHQA